MINNDKSMLEKRAYLDHTYSDRIAPKTDYPDRFARWLLDKVYAKPGTIADFGCGRGDYLFAFKDLGFTATGFDISPNIDRLSEFNMHQINFEKDDLSNPPEKFDYIFSKSVIEHLHSADTYVSAIHNSLNDGGQAVILTPSWEHTGWGPFYIDHTHVTPFTSRSLESILVMTGFKNVKVRYFYQLPLLWKFPFLSFMAKTISYLPIPYGPYYDVPWKVSNKFNKFVRFSKEVMLIATAEK